MSTWQKRDFIKQLSWSSVTSGVLKRLQYSIHGSADGGAKKPGGMIHPRGANPFQPPSGS